MLVFALALPACATAPSSVQTSACPCALPVAPPPATRMTLKSPEVLAMIAAAENRDGDGDGFVDHDDDCEHEPGVAPDGCPIPDQDGDEILDPDDQCVTQPETINGFRDEDGCPDEIPPQITRCWGPSIKGVYFNNVGNNARADWRPSGELAPASGAPGYQRSELRTTCAIERWRDSKLVRRASVIKVKSLPVLDRAVSVMREFPSIRVEISGHASSREGRSNDERYAISWARAETVRAYLVEVGGIDPERIDTRAAGADEPVASESTRSGRAKNRRVEVEVVEQ